MLASGATHEPAGQVLLRAGTPLNRKRTEEFLIHLGYAVLDQAGPGEAGAAGQPDVIVVLADGEGSSIARFIPQAVAEEPPPPVIVFGPAGGGDWRTRALKAGAFACLSLEAPAEERAGLLAAASRYRAALVEIRTLRQEANTLCTNLLKSFGDEASKLKIAVKQRQEIQKAIQDLRNRLVKEFVL